MTSPFSPNYPVVELEETNELLKVRLILFLELYGGGDYLFERNNSLRLWELGDGLGFALEILEEAVFEAGKVVAESAKKTL